MKNFAPGVLDRHPLAAAVTRLVLGVAVVSLLSAAMVTAGPGNGYQPPREVARVTLPQVVIVGQREAPRSALVASAAAGTPGNLTR